jgi:solute:Na+ symporter, SSS family
MAFIDWFVIVGFLVVVVVVGLLYSRRASKNMEEYFISGRNLPWWLAGTSILASSFSSDTPLHTTRVIRESGLGGAWFYWNGIISGLVVAFFFARLWRRAAIVTDAEYIELRYSGWPAALMRGVIALFRSFVLELITLAWITLGMTKIVRTVLDLPPTVALPALGAVRSEVAVVVILVAIGLLYSAMSGLWGVVVADFIEFIVAMGGAILLAVLALRKVGGVAGLREGLGHSALGAGALDFLPSATNLHLPTVVMVAYLGVQWWANTEVDGSGKRAQRFLACKDERNALASGVWNMAVQWVLRNWPWYITALASLLLYPELKDHEAAYPRLIADLMPIGLKGLMVASLLAAFLATFTTLLNLAASYLVNDIYRRFLARRCTAGHYVTASRLVVVVIAALSTALALSLPSVLDAFRFKMELMAGLGLVYVLRWFWWRVSAWTEIAALLTGIATTAIVNIWKPFGGIEGGAEAFAWRLITIVVASTVVALLVTLLGRPVITDGLREFFRRVRPPALFWRPVAELEAADDRPAVIDWGTAGQYVLCGVAVFTAMFAVGKLIFGEWPLGIGLAVVAVASSWATLRWVFGRRS